MTSGYSGKSLVDKLGLKSDYRLFIQNPPQNMGSLIPLNDYNVSSRLSGAFHIILSFTKSFEILSGNFNSLKKHVVKNGSLWICWLKKSSKICTGLDENIIREYGLDNGMVDVKVCAVDEFWSGLMFVFRLKDR